MPLGRIFGTRLGLSYTVFIAAAIIFAVVVTVSGRQGNTGLVQATVLGVAFWVSGWLLQAVTHFLFAWLLGLRLSLLSIGLLGVESSPRNWSAPRALLVAFGTLASLLLLGGFYRLVEGGFQMPIISRVPDQPLTAPSIGFESFDSIWRSGAWLCWVQALCQMYPLPRTMGRQIVGGLCGMLGRRFDLSTQASLFRRCIAMVAFLTLLLTAVLMSGQAGLVLSQWPLLALMGILLWLSSRGSDVTSILLGFQSASDASGQESLRRDSQSHGGMISRIGGVIRSRQEHQRLQKVLEQERSEAVDAARLDEILNQLHQNGIESLAPEDRKILERISENLRRQRRLN